MNKKIVPFGDRVLVEELKVGDWELNGLMISEGAIYKGNNKGRVISIGEGELINSKGLKEGDIIMWKTFTGRRVVGNDYNYILVDYGDILGKIEF